jgi:hypothetical protein
VHVICLFIPFGAFLTTNFVAKAELDEKHSMYNYQISFSSNQKRKQWGAKCAVSASKKSIEDKINPKTRTHTAKCPKKT